MTKPIVKNMCICHSRSYFDKVTSWPQLISKLLIAPACLYAASNRPRTFCTIKVFLFSIKPT